MRTNEYNKDYSTWIEAYIDGLLNEQEKKEFEERLNTDDELAHEYNMRKKLAKVLVEALEYEQTRENVAKAISKINSTKISYKVVFSIAAAIIILIGIFAVLKLSKDNNQKMQMAKTGSAKTYKPKINKSVHLSKVNYYRPFSSVSKNEVVTVLEIPGENAKNAGSTYLYKMVLTNAILDETVNQLFFTSKKRLLSGKYVYINDSISGGQLFHRFKSLKSKPETFAVNADSIRVNIP